MYITSLFTDSPAELLKTLRSLVEVLIHLEPSVIKTAISTPQVSKLTALGCLYMYVSVSIIERPGALPGEAQCLQ